MGQPDLDSKLEGIMEYYVRQFFAANEDKVKEEMHKLNYFLDPDMLEQRIDGYVEDLTKEVSEKFHAIAFLVLTSVVRLEEAKIRNFEVLFIDLVNRTLLEGKERDMQPISIVIADPNVSSEES